MPRRALVERRPWLLGSLTAGLAFFALSETALAGLYLLGIKAAATGMLAIYALLRHRSTDSRWLVFFLALTMASDVAVEIDPRVAMLLGFGGLLAAINLFLHNRRAVLTPSQKGAAVALLALTPLIAIAITMGQDMFYASALYALTLGAMAALAWASHFSRYRVGLGAVLFLVAELLTMAINSGRLPYDQASMAAWPLHYIGLFLIATGVIQTLRHELPES